MVVDRWQRMGQPIAPLGGALIAQAVRILVELGASPAEIAAGLRDMAEGAEQAGPAPQQSTH